MRLVAAFIFVRSRFSWINESCFTALEIYEQDENDWQFWQTNLMWKPRERESAVFLSSHNCNRLSYTAAGCNNQTVYLGNEIFLGVILLGNHAARLLLFVVCFWNTLKIHFSNAFYAIIPCIIATHFVKTIQKAVRNVLQWSFFTAAGNAHVAIHT